MPPRRPIAWTTDDLPELQKARALWDQSPAQALEIFEKTAKRHPRNLTAILDAARALGTAHELPAARSLLQRAATQLSKTPQGLEQLGQSYRMARLHEEARSTFEKSITDPNCIESAIELAIFYERRHQLEDFERVLGPALKRNPEIPALQLLEARRLFRRDEMNKAIQRYRDIASNENAHAYHRASALFELANLQDKQGDYKGAYQSALEAKDQLRPMAEGLIDQSANFDDQNQRLLEAMTPQRLASWQSQAEPSEITPCFFTGCPRSGTTLFERMLGGHPQVQAFDELDIYPYFLSGALLQSASPEATGEEALEGIPKSWLKRQGKRYWKLFANHQAPSKDTRVLLDKNPSATGRLPVFLRMFPHAKLLFAERDPRDIAISCFLRFLPLNPVSVAFLEPNSTIGYVSRELTLGLEMQERLPSEIFSSIRYENFVKSPAKECSRIIDFLGLDQEVSMQDYQASNRKDPVNSPTYLEVTKPIHQGAVDRWKNYEFAFGEAFEGLSKLTERMGY